MNQRKLLLLVGRRGCRRRRRDRSVRRPERGYERDGDQGGDDASEDGREPLRPGRPAVGQGHLHGQSGGTLHVVNNAADEGPHTFTVVRRRTMPKTACRRSSTARSATTLAKAHGAESEQRRAAEVPVPRERRRPEDAAERRQAGRLRRHGHGQEGRVHRPEGDRQDGHEALLHVPHPPVDAGRGRSHLSFGSTQLRRARTWAVPAPSPAAARALPAAPDPTHYKAPDDRLLGRRRADVVEHHPERPRRDHGHGRSRRRSRCSRRSSTGATRPNWRKPVPNAPRGERRRPPDPGPAAPRPRRRPPPRPLQEHGHAPSRPALDAFPRRPLPRRARTAPTCPGSRAATPTCMPGHSLHLPADRRRATRPASGPTTTTRPR